MVTGRAVAGRQDGLDGGLNGTLMVWSEWLLGVLWVVSRMGWFDAGQGYAG